MRAANIFEIRYHLKNNNAFFKAHKSFLSRLDKLPMPEGTPARFIIDTRVSDGFCLLMFINTKKGFFCFKSLIKEKNEEL